MGHEIPAGLRGLGEGGLPNRGEPPSPTPASRSPAQNRRRRPSGRPTGSHPSAVLGLIRRRGVEGGRRDTHPSSARRALLPSDSHKAAFVLLHDKICRKRMRAHEETIRQIQTEGQAAKNAGPVPSRTNRKPSGELGTGLRPVPRTVLAVSPSKTSAGNRAHGPRCGCFTRPNGPFVGPAGTSTLRNLPSPPDRPARATQVSRGGLEKRATTE